MIFRALVTMPGNLFLESGYFFVVSKVDLRLLRELFRAHVLKMLKKEDLIEDFFIKMLMSWQHVSGFNVHNEVRIKPYDEKGSIEDLSQHMIRNTFSLEKLKYEKLKITIKALLPLKGALNRTPLKGVL